MTFESLGKRSGFAVRKEPWTRQSMQTSYRQLILHCGIHKTGSSYLQVVLSQNAEKLASRGVHYPTFRNRNINYDGNHSVVAVGYRGEPNVLDYFGSRLNLQSTQPTLLISGEEFSRPHIFKQLINNLVSNYPGLKIVTIFYLRRFDHLLESVYSESVKRTLVGGIENASYELNFADIIRPAVEQLGSENVVIRPYDKKKWYRGLLGADFLHCIGLSDAFDERAGIAAPEVNVSLSRTHTFILSCISGQPAKEAMLSFFRSHPLIVPDSTRYFMSPQRRTELNRSHVAQSESFFKNIGISDFSEFLGIESIVNEPKWAPFIPETRIIDNYLRTFIDAGHTIDYNRFMDEVGKRQ